MVNYSSTAVLAALTVACGQNVVNVAEGLKLTLKRNPPSRSNTLVPEPRVLAVPEVHGVKLNLAGIDKNDAVTKAKSAAPGSEAEPAPPGSKAENELAPPGVEAETTALATFGEQVGSFVERGSKAFVKCFFAPGLERQQAYKKRVNTERKLQKIDNANASILETESIIKGLNIEKENIIARLAAEEEYLVAQRAEIKQLIEFFKEKPAAQPVAESDDKVAVDDDLVRVSVGEP